MSRLLFVSHCVLDLTIAWLEKKKLGGVIDKWLFNTWIKFIINRRLGASLSGKLGNVVKSLGWSVSLHDAWYVHIIDFLFLFFINLKYTDIVWHVFILNTYATPIGISYFFTFFLWGLFCICFYFVLESWCMLQYNLCWCVKLTDYTSCIHTIFQFAWIFFRRPAPSSCVFSPPTVVDITDLMNLPEEMFPLVNSRYTHGESSFI